MGNVGKKRKHGIIQQDQQPRSNEQPRNQYIVKYKNKIWKWTDYGIIIKSTKWNTKLITNLIQTLKPKVTRMNESKTQIHDNKIKQKIYICKNLQAI